MTHLSTISKLGNNTELSPNIPKNVIKKIKKYLNEINSNKLTNLVNKILSQGDNYIVIDSVRRLHKLFSGESKYCKYFFEEISEFDLEKILRNGYLKLHEFIALKLLPTPELLRYFFEGNIAILKENKDVISEGKFSLNNRLHIELEYSRYYLELRDLFQKHKDITLEDFASIGNGDLPGKEKEEARNIAKDNSNILSLIQSNAQIGKVLVLFNKRYGENYVGNIIREKLKQSESVECKTIYVKSIDFDSEEKMEEYIASNDNNGNLDIDGQRTIIVIDGTEYKSGKNDKKRFPSAMNKVIYDINKDDIYNLRFWIPSLGEINIADVSLGWWNDNIKPCNSDKNKKDLIIIRANGLSDGIFDDVDDKYKEMRLIFGNNGITEKQLAVNEFKYLSIISKQINLEFEEILAKKS